MKSICVLLSFFVLQSLSAQNKLPIIKATSKAVTINDGGYIEKNGWTLSPKIKPDIFTADRTRQTKWVIFYTDIDSIKVKLKPGKKFDFIVLLNGKDSCYTQIASAIPPEPLLKNKTGRNDTIPFILTSFNAISVPAVINNTDTLILHFDVGSFDFRLTKDAILKKTKLLPGQPDAIVGKPNPNYNNLNKVSRLQMGNVTWTEPEIVVTGFTAHDMDGRFGWNLFEGRQVEIDYDNNLLIIHNTYTKVSKTYTRSKLNFIHSFVCTYGSFEINNKKYTGNFLLDTGSDQAIILDSAWANEQNFPADLPVLKTTVLKDPRGATYKSRVIKFPLFTINNISLSNIPALVLGSKNPTGFKINYLGNDLLKRFNIILDFKNDYLYLKPNKLMKLTFRENS